MPANETGLIRITGAAVIALSLCMPWQAPEAAECADGSDLECVTQHAIEAAANIRADKLHFYYEDVFFDLGRLLSLTGTSGDGVSTPNMPAERGLVDGLALGLLEKGDLERAIKIVDSGMDKAREQIVRQLVADGRLEEAEDIGRLGNPHGQRQKLYGIIARALHEVGRTDEAHDLLLDELALVVGLNADYTPEALCWLLAELNDLPDSGYAIPDETAAIGAAMEIENTGRRQDALRKVSWCLTDRGEFRKAIRAVSLLDDRKRSYDQLASIAADMVRAHDVEGAMNLVKSIPETSSSQAFGYDIISAALIGIGHLEMAEYTTRMVEFTYPNGMGRAQLAEAYLERGQTEKATEHLRKALEVLDDRNRKNPGSSQVWSLLRYLERTMRLLDPNEVDAHLDRAIHGLETFQKEQGASSLTWAVEEASRTLAIYGRPEKAFELILTHLPEDERLKAMTRAGLAMATVEAVN